MQAARIIALSMTTLDVLAEAKTADVSQSMRIRIRNRANGLNRSTIQTENSLDKHLASDVPEAPEPTPDAVHDQPDVQDADAVEYARAAIDAHRGQSPDADPLSAELDERDKRLYAGAMLDMLKQMGHPAQPIPPGSPDNPSQTIPSAATPSIS